MLIKSTPNMKKGKLYGIPGKAPAFSEGKRGCAFADRCNKSMDKCYTNIPLTVSYENSIVNCNLYKELAEEEIIV